MAITRFEDLPSENSPINSANLNGNFDELGVKVGTSVDSRNRVNVLHSKNLLNYTIPLTTNFGVTTSMSDGKLILDGTTTGDGDFIYTNSKNILLLKAGTYTISATKISGTYQKNNKDTAIYIRKTGDDTILFNLMSVNDYSRVTTITLTEDTLIHLNIYTSGSGMVFTNLVVSLQIERGRTATDFEIPVTPSINVDGETIYTKGQNEVYSTSEVVIGTWIDGKPRYRKTIDYTIASGTGTWHTIETMSNIESLVIKEVFVIRTTEIYLNIYDDYIFYYSKTTGYLSEQHSSAYYEGYHMYITIEYTKTTDA